MRVRNLRGALVFAIAGGLLLSNAPFTPNPQAQMSASCAREINKLDRDTRAFHEDLKKQNLDFAWSDATGHTLTDTKDLLNGKPDEIALRKLKDIKSTAVQYADDMMAYKATMDRLGACLNGGPKGCLLDIVKQQKAEFARWINSLADHSLTEAAKRVKDAGSLLQGYALNTASMAVGGMMRGLDACIDETQKSVDQSRTTADARPAGARPTGNGAAAPAAPPAAPPASSGLSGGAKAAIFVGVVGGGAALAAGVLASEGAGGGCKGSPPDINVCFATTFSAPACQSALAALDAYCASCNPPQKRGTGSTAAVQSCVPR